MQQLEESRAETDAAAMVSLFFSVIWESADIHPKAMKDRETELVGAKAESRKNEEVRLITSKSDLKLTQPTFLLSCSCSRQSRVPYSVKFAWIYLKNLSRTLCIRH